MSSTSPVRLACQTCAQRKVKCDKRSPCTNCLKHGISCIAVERRRWPRGRSSKQATGRDREPLNNERLSKSSTQRVRGIGDGPSTDGKTSKVQNQKLRKPHLGSLQRTEEETLPQLPRLPLAFDNGKTMLVGRSIGNTQNKESNTEAGHTTFSSSQVQRTLLQVFLRQVDPMFKILHRPSLCAFLVEGRPYLDYDRGHPAPMALTSAIFYVASSTLGDEQSIQLFGESKETMVAKYKNETKSALMKLDFLATNEVTVLQAFVLSLVAAKIHDGSRRVWTMLSIALRIAQALSLHVVDPPFLVRPFEREMRRRLWHLIGWLDVEASMDRASEPMMRSVWIQPHPLSNVNDEDFGFDSEEISQTTGNNLTDATNFKMISHAQCIIRSFDLSHFAEPGITDVCMRQQAVDSFQRYADILLARCEPDISAFHWFISQLRDRVYDTLRLVALRPLQRERVFFTVHQTDTEILALAGDILEQRQKLYSDPLGQPWRWFETFFFPRHALAVAMAEVSTSLERSVVDRYWPTIENSYSYFRQLAVDAPRRLGGKSMDDLIRDARAARDNMACNGTLGVANVHVPAYMDVVPSQDLSLDPLSYWQQGLQSTVPGLSPAIEWDMPQAPHPQVMDAWDQFGSLIGDLPELEDVELSIY